MKHTVPNFVYEGFSISEGGEKEIFLPSLPVFGLVLNLPSFFSRFSTNMSEIVNPELRSLFIYNPTFERNEQTVRLFVCL